MAKSVNKVILLGNVGKDPEIRSTPSGAIVANFTLATSDNFQDQQGAWQERTEWHTLVAFKRTAEIVRDYVKKGSKLYIEGKLQTRSPARRSTALKSSSTTCPFCRAATRALAEAAEATAAARRTPRARPIHTTSARPPVAPTMPSLSLPRSPTTIFRSETVGSAQLSVFC
jgi:single stranded DNA-binding protein